MKIWKISGEHTVIARGRNKSHTDWQLDNDPSSRAWANILGSLQRYSGGEDSNHAMKMKATAGEGGRRSDE